MELWFPAKIISHTPLDPPKVENPATPDVAMSGESKIDEGTIADTVEDDEEDDEISVPPTALLVVQYCIGYGLNGDPLLKTDELTLPNDRLAPIHTNSGTKDRYLAPEKV